MIGRATSKPDVLVWVTEVTLTSSIASILAKAIAGMKQLAKNGLRYPIAPYGIQADVRAGMGVSYGKK